MPRMKQSAMGLEQADSINAKSVMLRNLSHSRNDSGAISAVSPRDLLLSQKFDQMKQKYQGSNSKLMLEKKLNKNRLAEQRNKMEALRKNYKMNKI